MYNTAKELKVDGDTLREEKEYQRLISWIQ